MIIYLYDWPNILKNHEETRESYFMKIHVMEGFAWWMGSCDTTTVIFALIMHAPKFKHQNDYIFVQDRRDYIYSFLLSYFFFSFFWLILLFLFLITEFFTKQ